MFGRRLERLEICFLRPFGDRNTMKIKFLEEASRIKKANDPPWLRIEENPEQLTITIEPLLVGNIKLEDMVFMNLEGGDTILFKKNGCKMLKIPHSRYYSTRGDEPMPDDWMLEFPLDLDI